MNLRRLRTAGRRLQQWPLLGLLLSTACASSGPVDNPTSQRLTWFTYAAGTDIRDRCRAGAPDQYRFIYNGQYERQVRAYDIQVLPEGGAELLARARGGQGNLARFSLNNPLGPWALEERRSELSPNDIAALLAALDRDTAVAPTAAGQRLNSLDFYWLVSQCRGGAFRLDAFVHPRVNHASLSFPSELLALDSTGVPFREARQFEGGRRNSFQLHINQTGNGLVG